MVVRRERQEETKEERTERNTRGEGEFNVQKSPAGESREKKLSDALSGVFLSLPLVLSSFLVLAPPLFFSVLTGMQVDIPEKGE